MYTLVYDPCVCIAKLYTMCIPDNNYRGTTFSWSTLGRTIRDIIFWLTSCARCICGVIRGL